MRNWVYKVKFAFIRTLQLRWQRIISQFFACIGVVFTISEILNNIFSSTYGFDFIRMHTVGLIIALGLMCMAANWKTLRYTCFLENADTKITLVVDDIFRQTGAIVVPTNTTFDTLMDDEFISLHSVQGQYQEKFYSHALTTLNREIEAELVDIPYVELEDGRKTNRKRYEIGTTCKISNGQQHAYLLSVADINKHGKPENVTLENITSALVSFWQTLNEKGHLEAILMPILGTGRAGIKDASRDKIIQEIIFSFILAAREMKVTENLVICIHPSDFVQKNLHWDDLCEYLRYTCKYQYQENSARREGTPEGEQCIARFG